MNKYLIIDSRMRKIEKNYLTKLGYNLIEIPQNPNLYYEISSHPDIHICKIKSGKEYKYIIEKWLYEHLMNEYFSKNQYLDLKEKLVIGNSYVTCKYPNDVNYNVCNIGDSVIHNFNYTDINVLKAIKKSELKKLNVKQGYSNCSIAIIDESSIITSDKKIDSKIKKNNINSIYVDSSKCNIKLLSNNELYSNMNGFIGGCMSKIGNRAIWFGDLDNIPNHEIIRNLINKKNLELVEFKGLDLIDYGKVIEIE